jgi:7-cyano-7-deazaguanosine (preQ0) biosynthesis protein QueE
VTDLVVSEVFGPTWQGEGPSAGLRAGFVRLGRCLLDCQWCDTSYTWDWQRHDPGVELSHRTVASVVAELDGMAVTTVVVTGGEPLLQQGGLGELVASCHQRGWRVEVETAGVLEPALDVDQWNVSPKLANSGVAPERRYKPEILLRFQATGRAAFKFVACTPGDLDEVATIVDECGLTNVWIMPEGTTPDAITSGMAELAPAVLDHGWNLTPRLHILIWGDRRGV